MNKENYASRLFALPIEQVKTFDELTAEQKEKHAQWWGKTGADQYVYCIKKSGELIHNRERIRPEWQ